MHVRARVFFLIAAQVVLLGCGGGARKDVRVAANEIDIEKKTAEKGEGGEGGGIGLGGANEHELLGMEAALFLGGFPDRGTSICNARVDIGCARLDGICAPRSECPRDGQILENDDGTGGGCGNIFTGENNSESTCVCCSRCAPLTRKPVDGFKCRLYGGTCLTALECLEKNGRFYPTLCSATRRRERSRIRPSPSHTPS